MLIEWIERLKKKYISTVIYGEILQGVRDKKELKQAKEFLSQFDMLWLDQEISRLTLELLENYHLRYGLLLVDSLIAATAIINDLILVTDNVRHFEFINGLRVLRPEDV